MNNPFDKSREETVRVIANAPGYFLAWYTFKSVALVGAVATAAYQMGRRRAEREKAKASPVVVTTTGNVSPIGGRRG